MAAAAGPSALWYLTRGTGAVALVLLTITVALGVANARRWHGEGVPRFVIDAVHRYASLLSIAFLLVHIMTSVLDTYAPIRLLDAVVPFVSAYRPVWVGLGAVAFDLLIAVAVSSLMRRRLGHRAWRSTHWLAYACWPVALVHGLGSGSDAKATWMLALSAGCVLAVLGAVAIRITAGWPQRRGVRTAAIAVTVAAPVVLLIWLSTGPLAPGWAKRAGTPVSLLRTSYTTAATPAATATASSGSALPAPAGFTTSVTGTINQSQLSAGLVQLSLRLSLARPPLNRLRIEIVGQPLPGGGVAMSSSGAQLGTAADPGLYSGRVTGLDGTSIAAAVHSARGSLALLAELRIDPNTKTVTGTLTTNPHARDERRERIG